MFLIYTSIASLVDFSLELFLSSSPPSSSSLPSPKSHYRRLTDTNNEAQISPSIIVIIVILTIIFFLSGCLHLLIRCIARNPRRDSNAIVTLTALQGQLQQLFHLHDSGVEQGFIDTLPVFHFRAVTGLKEGADCAVCLCEFQGDDRLRLLPNCSHAFHLDCIDTWLLSHSTCPLCRRSLLPDGLNLPSVAQGALLESSRTSADGAVDAETGHGNSGTDATDLQYVGEESRTRSEVGGSSCINISDAQRLPTVVKKEDKDDTGNSARSRGKVVTVQLGRFRIAEGDSSCGASGSNVSRRSYSVGSYEYVLDPANLQVVIAPTPSRRRTSTPRPPIPGHRTTLSDFTPEHASHHPGITPHADYFCDKAVVDVSSPFWMSRHQPFARPMVADKTSWVSINLDSTSTEPAEVRESATEVGASAGKHERAFEQDLQEAERRIMGRKAFLLGQRLASEEANSSRRAFSFRLPISDANLDAKLKVSASRRSLSETELVAWSEEDRSFSNVRLMSRTQDESNVHPALNKGMPSIAKRTINWLVGRQKRIMHTSSVASEAAPR